MKVVTDRTIAELRSTIALCEAETARWQHEFIKASATIERQRELLNSCALAMAASHNAGLNGSRTDWTKMIDAITALQAELPKEKKDGVTFEDPYGY